MAKKKFSKINVKTAIEKAIEGMQELRKHSRTGSRQAQHYTSEIYGMYHLAYDLGFDCKCRPGKKKAALCRCEARKTSFEGIGGFTLDGAGCRDKAGNFVPIARCNPPWAKGKNVHIEIVERTATGKKKRRRLG